MSAEKQREIVRVKNFKQFDIFAHSKELELERESIAASICFLIDVDICDLAVGTAFVITPSIPWYST